MENKAARKRILGLLDGKPGHVHQTEGVLKHLDDLDHDLIHVRFRSKSADNALRSAVVLGGASVGKALASTLLDAALTPESRRATAELPPPAAILSTGSSVAAPNVLLARIHGCRAVVCTRPSPIGVRPFDVAIVPHHQREWFRPSDIPTIGVPTPITPESVETRRLELLAGAVADGRATAPTIGLLIGGNDKRYRWSVSMAETVLEALLAVASRNDMRLAIATSRRTPLDVEAFIRARVVESPMCAYSALAHDPTRTDESAVETVCALSMWVAVTVDSFSMVCEAASSGKPVGLISVKPRRPDRYAQTYDIIAAQTGMVRMRLNTLYETAMSMTQNPQPSRPLHDAEDAATGVRAALGLS